MDSFAARAMVFTIVLTGVVMVGFNGFAEQVDIKWDTCESHFKRYVIKPFLVPVVCALTKMKPCGDFPEHRANMSHIQMYDCLCRDPRGNERNLRTYSTEYDRDSGLPSDGEGICFRRPRTSTL